MILPLSQLQTQLMTSHILGHHRIFNTSL